MTEELSETSGPGSAYIRSWILLLILLVALGLAGQWSKPPTYDEEFVYIPAIQFLRNLLPSVPFDYPFVGPPLGLLIQASVAKATDGSLLALRLLSTVFALLIGVVLCRAAGQMNAPSSGFPMLMTISLTPHLIYNAFTIKHYTLLLLLLILCLSIWEKATTTRPRLLPLFVFVGMMAAGTNQFSIALFLSLALGALIQYRHNRSVNELKILGIALSPLIVTAAYMLLWKGFQPPLYRTKFLEGQVGALGFNAGQLFLGLFCLGALIFPIVDHKRRDLVTAATLVVPCAFLIHYAGVFHLSRNFYQITAGPLSTVLRSTCGFSYSLKVFFAALLGAAGAAMLVAPSTGVAGTRFKVYALCYLAMMQAVPYLFESYYVFLVVPSMFILRERIFRQWSFRRPAALAQLGIMCSGLIYLFAKFA